MQKWEEMRREREALREALERINHRLVSDELDHAKVCEQIEAIVRAALTAPASAAPATNAQAELLRLGERASRWFADGTRTAEPLDLDTAIKCIDGALGALEAK